MKTQIRLGLLIAVTTLASCTLTPEQKSTVFDLGMRVGVTAANMLLQRGGAKETIDVHPPAEYTHAKNPIDVRPRP